MILQKAEELVLGIMMENSTDGLTWALALIGVGFVLAQNVEKDILGYVNFRITHLKMCENS